jgi:hypothetical protein
VQALGGEPDVGSGDGDGGTPVRAVVKTGNGPLAGMARGPFHESTG